MMLRVRVLLYITAFTLGYGLVFHSINRTNLKADNPIEQERDPASLRTSLNQCVAAIRNRNKFNEIEFESSYQEFSNYKDDIPNTKIKNAMDSPERILALIEVLWEKSMASSLNIRDRVANSTEAERKAIRKSVKKMVSKRQLADYFRFPRLKNGDAGMTDYHFRQLLVKIYRETNRPRSFLKSLWDFKSLKKTFEEIDNNKIMERIDIAIFRNRIGSVLNIITRDPGLKVKFYQVLDRHRVWVRVSLATLLWGAIVSIAPEFSYDGTVESLVPLLFYTPLYIPKLSKFIDDGWTDQLNKQFQHRPDELIAVMKEKFKEQAKSERSWATVSRGYSMIITTLFVAAVMEFYLPVFWERAGKPYMEEMTSQVRSMIIETSEERAEKFYQTAEDAGKYKSISEKNKTAYKKMLRDAAEEVERRSREREEAWKNK